MNLFKLRQYIKYRRKALGRHGLHSPFAYAFVEDVLRNISSRAELLPYMAEYYSIRKFFEYENGALVNKDVARVKKNFKKSSFEFERVVVFTGPEAVSGHMSSAGAGDILVVEGIHNNEEHLASWEQLCADSRVRMSIDVFDYGLLLFREEFRVKQDFVLR